VSNTLSNSSDLQTLSNSDDPTNICIDVDVGLSFGNDILKQRDVGATLIKVYVTPDEHEMLKKLCASRGGMSHVLRKLAIKWAESEIKK
jgi:hypothetical protein